jgi:holo-[acyl-carrier protein] synthase
MTAVTSTRSGCPDSWLAEAFGQFPAEGSRGDRPPTIRVGVDLVAVADVMESVKRFGDRYLQRIFTPHEIAHSRSDLGPRDPALRYSFESLAARFAAKEATVKVLRPLGPRPEWRSIEVFRTEGGWCEIRLRGRASALADLAGIDRWAVSLTHEAAMAAAVVVGVERGDSAGGHGASSSDRGEG